MSVATGTRTTSEIVTLTEDGTDRWQVYPGTAPETATAPFVSIYPASPIIAAQSICFDDFGAIRPRWQISTFAASIDQARWLLGELMAKSWPNMLLELIDDTFLDPTEQPDLYVTRFVLRDHDVTDR